MGKKVMWRIFLIITIVFLYSFIKKYVVEDINIEIQLVYYLILIILMLSAYIKAKIFIILDEFKDEFNFLKDVHKNRYHLYFSNIDREELMKKVNDYNEIIQLNGIALITEGENMINENILSKQEKSIVDEIMKKTKKLLKEVQPEKEGD